MNDHAHIEDVIQQLSFQDKVLADVIAITPFPEYANTFNVYEDLLSCVMDMRIHYTPTNAAFRYKRLKKLIDGIPITPQVMSDLPQSIIAQLKLSYQKSDGIQALNEHWNDHDLENADWSSMDSAAIHETLGAIKGIGTWTVQMIELFSLERPDILPIDDYQLRKSMSSIYGFEDDSKAKSRMKSISEAWKPYRSLAVRYLWRHRELKL